LSMAAHSTPGGNDRRSRAVAVIGAGYVGLPTAATLAHFGHRVVLAEQDEYRLAALRSGRMPIVEAGLDELVAEGVSAGLLRFTASAAEAVAGAEFVLLCVPTPQGDDGSADLSYVEAAAKEVGMLLEPGAIVVNKSTVPVGSATLVEQVIGRPDVRQGQRQRGGGGAQAAAGLARHARLDQWARAVAVQGGSGPPADVGR